MNTNIDTNPDRPTVAAAATAAVTGAAAWLALAADSILRPDPRAYRDALVLVPWILFYVQTRRQTVVVVGVVRLDDHVVTPLDDRHDRIRCRRNIGPRAGCCPQRLRLPPMIAAIAAIS